MINDFHCLYINLAHRVDRRMIVEQELRKHGIEAERVEGIKGNPYGLPTRGLGGDVGCTLSHVKCVQIAKDSGWKSVMVFEDDVEFRDNVNELFDEYMRRTPDDWDMIYLGGNHWGRDLGMKNNPPLTKVAENVYRTTYTLTTHAYLLRDTMYDKVIGHLSTAYMPVDVMYTDLQKENVVYAFRPNIAWQRADKSDINNRNCDYVYFLRDW